MVDCKVLVNVFIEFLLGMNLISARNLSQERAAQKSFSHKKETKIFVIISDKENNK